MPSTSHRSSLIPALTRENMERHQVWWYLTAVALGLAFGVLWPEAATTFETLVWPVLGLLLFATFTQVPLASIPAAFKDARFLTAALIGNFVALPLIVWGLIQFTPNDAALRLGLLLVLLVPCTDWFITFTQLGRGDAAHATAMTPLLLLTQLVLLPVYLWIMADTDVAAVFSFEQVWPAFLVLLAPLGLATVGEIWLTRHPAGPRVRAGLGHGPVPLLSVVIFLVAAVHAGPASEALHMLPIVIGIAAAFLIVGLVLSKTLATLMRMPTHQGRTLAFSFGTRNSFIVLPFALSLPADWEITAVVIVMQSLVELFGMIFYLWFVPNVLFRAINKTHSSH